MTRSNRFFSPLPNLSRQEVVEHLKRQGLYASLAEAEYPLAIDPLISWQTRLTAGGGAAHDRFGFSVAVSGDTAVIGAPLRTTGRGEAYVFMRGGAGWSEQARLNAEKPAADDRFGDSVAIDGDTAVVGASGAIVDGKIHQGAAYVFVRSGATWTRRQSLTASDGAANDFFGYSVAISGDTAVVGALDKNNGRGAAYVFVRDGAAWGERKKLTPSDGADHQEFGCSVAISGDTVAVGAPAGDSAMRPGAVYIFVRDGNAWSEQAKLMASDGAANDRFGRSVAISGDTVAVGSPGPDLYANERQGAAYVFVRGGATWSEPKTLAPPDRMGNDQFGSSVAISGDMAVIGASGGIQTGRRGAAHVFSRSGSAWGERRRLTAPEGARGAEFGCSVAIDGDTIVIGARIETIDTSANQGAAYVFSVCPSLVE